MKEKKSVAEMLCIIFPIITVIIIIGCVVVALKLPSVILNNTEVDIPSDILNNMETIAHEKTNIPAEEEWSIVFTPIDFSTSRDDVISMLGQPYSEENNLMKYKCTYKENRGDLWIKLFGLDTDVRKQISWYLKDGGTKEISEIYLSALKEKYGDPVYDGGINDERDYWWWYYWIGENIDVVVEVTEVSTGGDDCSLKISYYEPGTHDLNELKKNSSDDENKYQNR